MPATWVPCDCVALPPRSSGFTLPSRDVLRLESGSTNSAPPRKRPASDSCPGYEPSGASYDAPDGSYPGHESLAGRFLGGAEFVEPDSSLNTSRDGSVNPEDRGGSATQSHGTHVAGIALGTGGASGYAVAV